MTPQLLGPTGPIAILGRPCRGTIWLDRIIDSHPDTLDWHEPDGSALREALITAEPDGASAKSARGSHARRSGDAIARILGVVGGTGPGRLFEDATASAAEPA